MKKTLSLLLVIGLIAITLSACGKKEEADFVVPKPNASEQTVDNSNLVDDLNKDNTDSDDISTKDQDPTKNVTEDEVIEDPAEVVTEPDETSSEIQSDNEWFTQVISAKTLSQTQGTLEWVDKAGKTVNLSNGGGKIYLIDVWAQWCPPCRASTPTMIALYNKFKDKGLVVIGINADSQEDLFKAKEYALEEGIKYPLLHDPKSTKIAGIYVGRGIPAFTLIASDGTVLFTNEGAITEGSQQASKLEGIIIDKLGL